MGFGAPFALLLLAAGALPIVAHLMRRQDLPVVRLPTIELLKRAEASRRRRVRLVDLLLLIVRVALTLAAALALSDPYYRVALAYGDGRVASVVIVLDDSMSMFRGDPSLLQRATGRSREIVDALPEGSQVGVVLGSRPARVLVPLTDDRSVARNSMSTVATRSARGTDLATAVELAERELASARHAARRIVVLSDLAAHGNLGGFVAPAGIDFAADPLAESISTDNVAVVEARATVDPLDPERAAVFAQIRASGAFENESLRVRLVRNDETISEQEVEIVHGAGRFRADVALDPDHPVAQVEVRADDALPVDNRRPVLVRRASGTRVLLVEGGPAGASEGRFLSRALDLTAGRGANPIVRRTVDPDTFFAMELSDVDVVILADVEAPNQAAADRLRAHVERGGGLWVCAGDHVDPRAYRARFQRWWPGTFSSSVAAPIAGPIPDPQGPLAEAVGAALESAETSRRLRIEVSAADAEVALRFEDDSAALVIGQHGSGRIALMATTVSERWTNLPYRPGFLPLASRLVGLLAPGGENAQSIVEAGQDVSLRAPSGAVRLRVNPPEGDPREWSGDDLDADIRFTAELAGFYAVEVATRAHGLRPQPELSFVVVAPAAESDLSPAEPPEQARSQEQDSAGVSIRRSLAPWLFLLLGVLAVAEGGLRVGRKRLRLSS